MIGQTISHYRILEKVGEGGMGTVYIAEDTILGRRVAVKSLTISSIPGKQHFRRRFLREARVISALNHPHIATIHDFGETEDHQPFIVMEFVNGPTLDDLIRNNTLTLERTLEIMEDVAEALAEAHRHGIVHRDIKPSNVALNERGEVKVLDFGLAKHLNAEGDAVEDGQNAQALAATKTREGVVLGTPLYLSPEQALGMPVDTRSDLFSMGSLLYECFTGKPTFSGSSDIEICAKVIRDDPPPPSSTNPRVTPELDNIVLKALAKKVEDRYQTIDELLADLRAAHVRLKKRGDKQKLYYPSILSRRDFFSGARKALSKYSRRLYLIAALALALALTFIIWKVFPFNRAKPYQPSPQAERWYQDGVNALHNGAYYKAKKILEETVKQDDRFALAHARLAEALMELDYIDEAKNHLIRAQELTLERSKLPPLDALRLQSVTDTVKRDFAKAAEGYNAIAKLVPDTERPSAYLDLGRVYENNEDLQKAIESYTKATELDQRYAAAFLRLGIAYGKQLETTKANAVFDEALRLFQIQNDSEGSAEVLYQRGVLFNKLDKLTDAHQQLQQALDMGQNSLSKPQRIKILLQLSSVIYSEGKPAAAQQLANEATTLAQEEGLENLTTNGLIDIGNTFLWQGKYSEAEGYFNQALQIARTNKGLRGEARARLSLGSLYVQEGDADIALPFIESALTFYQQGHYRKEISQALLLLGRAKELRGDNDAAIKAYEEEIQTAEQIGDLSQEGYGHIYLGSLLSYRENYPLALIHFNESERIDRLLKAQPRIGYDLMNRGNIEWQLGHYNEARELLDQARSSANQSDSPNKNLMAWILLFQSQMNLSERNLAEAISKSQEAISLAGKQYKDIAAQAMSTLGLAQTLSGMRSAGVHSCQDAIELAKSMRSPRLIASGQLALSEALLEAGNNQEALKTALTAQEAFAHSGQRHSEWRAWLIAALASHQLGDHTAAHEYAAHANDLLSQMQQEWGAENYNNYLSRPDIQYYRKQISEIRNSDNSD